MPDSTKDKYIGKAKLDLGEFAGNNKVCRWLRVVRFWCTLHCLPRGVWCVQTTRLYLLEKSKVNSGLLVTVEMKQISGDPMFKW